MDSVDLTGTVQNLRNLARRLENERDEARREVHRLRMELAASDDSELMVMYSEHEFEASPDVNGCDYCGQDESHPLHD